MAILRLKWQDINADRREALRYLGYRQGVSLLTPAVEGLLRQAARMVQEAAQPAASYVWCDPDAERYKFSERIGERVRGSSWLVCFAVTLGSGVDQLVADLFQRENPALASMVDAWGSAAAEAVARSVQRAVNWEANLQGFTTKFRLSPGYSGWSLEANRVLLADSQGWELGIRVTPEGLLLPRKSVLGIIPVFRADAQ